MPLITDYAASYAAISGETGWTNPAYLNGTSQETNWATAAPARNTYYGNDFRGFDFSSIPDGSTVYSVTVSFRTKESGTTNVQYRSAAYVGTTAIGPAPAYNPAAAAGATSAKTRTYTLSTITGLPTLAQLKDATFGIRCEYTRTTTTANTGNLAWISVTVAYYPPAPAAGTLGEDLANTPAVRSTTGSTSATLQSYSFSPQAGTLVVVPCSVALTSDPGANTTVSMQDSLGNAYTESPAHIVDNIHEYAGIHTRYYSTAPGSITVTMTRNNTAVTGNVQCAPRLLLNTKASQAGAAAATWSSTDTGLLTVTSAITPTAVGSIVFLAGCVYNNETSIAPYNASTASIATLNDATNASATMTGRMTDPVTSTTSTTLGWTINLGSRSGWAALEILGQTGLTYTRAGGGISRGAGTGTQVKISTYSDTGGAIARGAGTGRPDYAVRCKSGGGIVRGAGTGSKVKTGAIVKSGGGCAVGSANGVPDRAVRSLRGGGISRGAGTGFKGYAARVRQGGSVAVGAATGLNASGTQPQPFPDILHCSGNYFADSGGYVYPPMKGVVYQFERGAPLSEFQALYTKGARMVRICVFWDWLETSAGVLDGSYVSQLDSTVQNCVSAGLYCWIDFHFSVYGGSGHMPAWAETVTTSPPDAVENFIANGQFITQYLAKRYGDSGDPLGAGKYTKAVMGFGINEPMPDYSNANDWLTHLFSQHATYTGWFRTYAPDWICFAATGGYTAAAPVPNAPGSGQTTQTFTGLGANPSGLTNFCLDFHDYFWFMWTKSPVEDWRDQYGMPNWSVAQQNSNGTAGNYPPAGYSTPDLAAENAAWTASHEYYCRTYGVPWVIGECGFEPQTGTGWAANITDKINFWQAKDPVPAGITEWDYNSTYTGDGWATHPGTGQTGTDADGWQTWTNQFLAADITGTGPAGLEKTGGGCTVSAGTGRWSPAKPLHCGDTATGKLTGGGTAFTFSVKAAAGHLIMLATEAYVNSNTPFAISTVGDSTSGGNTWNYSTQQQQASPLPAAGDYYGTYYYSFVAIGWCVLTADITSITVTYTTAITNGAFLTAFDFALPPGSSVSSDVSDVNTTQATGTSQSSPSVSLSQNTDVVVAQMAEDMGWTSVAAPFTVTGNTDNAWAANQPSGSIQATFSGLSQHYQAAAILAVKTQGTTTYAKSGGTMAVGSGSGGLARAARNQRGGAAASASGTGVRQVTYIESGGAIGRAGGTVSRLTVLLRSGGAVALGSGTGRRTAWFTRSGGGVVVTVGTGVRLIVVLRSGKGMAVGLATGSRIVTRLRSGAAETRGAGTGTGQRVSLMKSGAGVAIGLATGQRLVTRLRSGAAVTAVMGSGTGRELSLSKTGGGTAVAAGTGPGTRLGLVKTGGGIARATATGAAAFDWFNPGGASVTAAGTGRRDMTYHGELLRSGGAAAKGEGIAPRPARIYQKRGGGCPAGIGTGRRTWTQNKQGGAAVRGCASGIRVAYRGFRGGACTIAAGTGYKPPPPAKRIYLRDITAGAPHGRWSARDVHGAGIQAADPHGRWSAAPPRGRYAAGSPHGRWASAGEPHG